MKPLHSVYTKILLTVLLVFALPLSVVFFYGYHSLEMTIQQKISQQSKINLDRLNESTQEMVNQISQTAAHISSSDVSFNELLYTYDQAIPLGHTFSYSGDHPGYINKYDYMKLSTELTTQLSNYADNWLPDGAQISLLLNDGQFFCTWSNYNTDFEVLNQILQQSGRDAFFYGVHSPLNLYGDTSQQISFVKNIYSMSDTRHRLAKVVITIPTSVFEKILKSYQDDNLFSFYILDSHKNIVAQAVGNASFSVPVTELIQHYDDLYEGQGESTTLENVFINRFLIKGPSWEVYLMAPYASIFQELTVLRQTVVSIGVSLIVLLAFVSFLLLYRILSPLRRLTVSMYDIEKGNWDTPGLPVKSRDEVGFLTERFNHLVARLREMIGQIKESERQKEKLKFEMLLAQINPHFLFNTLNSIKWMAMMIHADNIVETIRSLARLLEISMSRQKDVISIEEEVKNLHSYLEIQSLRYSGLFSTSFHIDERLNRLECIKLAFQPIVENAIIHNIQEEKPLDIHISGHLVENDVLLEITDNGKGMSPNQIQQLLSNDGSHEKSIFRGIGVNNVRQRLQLKYGGSYGVFITSTLGEGTTVQVRFPAVPFVSEQQKDEE